MKTSKLKEIITKRNKTFANKTNAEKRVLIAKDVLTQIKHKKFIPSNGGFLSFANLDYKTTNLRESFLTGRDLWEDGLHEEATCHCCALGGMMMSCTLFNNNIDIGQDRELIDDMGEEIRDNTLFPNGLNTIFSKKQLAMIEIAFEKGSGSFYASNTPEITFTEQCLCANYGRNFETPKERLRAIMRNIVKNKGEFIPE